MGRRREKVIPVGWDELDPDKSLPGHWLPAYTGQGSSPARTPQVGEQNLKPDTYNSDHRNIRTDSERLWLGCLTASISGPDDALLFPVQTQKQWNTRLRNLIAAITALQGFSHRMVLFLTFANIQENNELIHLILSNESHYSALLWSISEFKMQIKSEDFFSVYAQNYTDSLQESQVSMPIFQYYSLSLELNVWNEENITSLRYKPPAFLVSQAAIVKGKSC